MKTIGLVQTRGIGDIIIALPIADHFIETGYKVVWPVDRDFLPSFSQASPEIEFHPVDKGTGYFVNDPVAILKKQKCDRTIILYSYVSDQMVYDPRLAASLKFDEYKYATAGVPFRKKWDLKLRRDHERELALFNGLEIKGKFACVHTKGSNMREAVSIPESLTDGFQVIEIDERTDNPFDWLLTLERANRLILIDSCFSNLVEQLQFANEKFLILRSNVFFTPVYKNGWQFIVSSSSQS